MRPPKTVGAYLTLSYLYYIRDESAVPDHEYDMLCKWLLENYDSLSEHPHFHLLDKESLRGGTCYHLSEYDYPSRVKVIAQRYIDYGEFY